MRHGTTRAAVTAALGLAGLGLLGGTAVAAPEAPEAPEAMASWTTSYDDWDDNQDTGGISAQEVAEKNGTDEWVSGSFYAYGEKVYVGDQHDNDRRSIVRLWVGGSGPAVFYSDGDGTTRSIDTSYEDGQTVRIQACTSDSANAVCTERLAKGKS